MNNSQDWHPMPTTWGWWYKAPSKKDWDLGDIVRVTQITDSNGVRFEERGGHVIVEGEALWFGPFQVTRPQ